MRRVCFLAILAISVLATSVRAQEDLNELVEKMTKDAARKAGPSVVQIETRGGADMVVAGPKGQVFRKALGPTTGVVVDADGYIITSAYNFLNNPPIILVRIQGQQGEPLVATRVATDKSRMLTLLKVESKGLKVPEVVAKKDIKEGQTAIALGRALDAKMEKTPAICVGIISALGRVWGKALQTDAKISPINYGGPLVDIEGRVQGVIIPASPNGEDITAGIEWYNSGIGFAIPMEDIMAVLPRLKAGKDLQKGLMGIAVKSQDKFSVAPEIGTIQKGSSAEKAGLKVGDILVEVAGKPVVNMAQVQHILGPKYDGDKIALKYKRGNEIVEVKSLELTGQTVVIAQPFLGILPMRDDPELGVEIRHVFDKSPADKAGLKIGDRILKFGGADDKALAEFTGEKRGRSQFLDWLNTMTPGAEVKLAVKRKDGGKIDSVTATLSDLPGSLPGAPGAILDKIPEGPASFKKALAPLVLNNPNIKAPKIEKAPEPETGLIELNTPDGEHKYWLWVYPDYDPNVAHSLIVWMHPPGKNSREDLDGWADLWDIDYCRKHHIILLMPVEKQNGWQPTHADFIVAAVRETQKTYTIDSQRIVSHGMARGGEMALYLAFHHRDLFKGALVAGCSALTIKENVPNQRLSFLLFGGDLDPIQKFIADSRTKLAERRYPAFYRAMQERGRDYLATKDIAKAFRWLETLDQQ